MHGQQNIKISVLVHSTLLSDKSPCILLKAPKINKFIYWEEPVTSCRSDKEYCDFSSWS